MLSIYTIKQSFCFNQGAIAGLLVGLCMSSWLSIGSILMSNRNTPPPIVCPVADAITGNMTSTMTSLTSTMMTNITEVVDPVMETMTKT